MIDTRRQTVGLAPMEGVTDFPMRLWFYLASRPDSLTTPFLRLTSTFTGKTGLERFIPELTLARHIPYTTIPQVMTTDPRHLQPLSKTLLDSFPAIEINCGCPAPKCVGKGAGSGLLASPENFSDFVNTATRIVPPNRLRIKMRTGFNDDQNFQKLLQPFETMDLNQLTIHGRTSLQKYQNFGRWDLITETAERLSFPVVGSGDIVDTISYRNRQKGQVSGTIIGRGALRNPWIFSELRKGRPIKIHLEHLCEALGCLLLLYKLWASHPERLVGLVSDGLLATRSETTHNYWSVVLEALKNSNDDGDLNLADLTAPTPIFSRVKLIWNYLRSSLPHGFFSPQILRSKNFGSLLRALENCHNEINAPDDLKLEHSKQYDWVYTSDKKDPHASRAIEGFNENHQEFLTNRPDRKVSLYS